MKTLNADQQGFNLKSPSPQISKWGGTSYVLLNTFGSKSNDVTQINMSLVAPTHTHTHTHTHTLSCSAWVMQNDKNKQLILEAHLI